MPSVSPSGRSGGTTMTGWTTDANGNTIFAPTDPLHNGWLVIQAPVGSKVNETDAVYLKDEDGGNVGVFACDGGMVFSENTLSTDGFNFNIGPISQGFVVRVGGNFKLVVDGAGHIGFFGSTTAAQQTIHSGTATPESLALALEASTLMTGD